jgi:hypothetical protein
VSLPGRNGTLSAPTVRDGLVRHRVVVTLSSGEGVQGILWATDVTGILVRGAPGEPVQLIEAGDDGDVRASDVDGEVFVPADRVLFVQVMGASG